MKTSSIAGGSILFTLPDSASDIEEIRARPTRRRRRGAGGAGEPDEITQILDALTEDEASDAREREALVSGFRVDVGDGKAQRRRRQGAAAKPGSVDIDITLGPDEGAVVLIEQDGAYEWHFPQKVASRKRRRRRGGPSVVESRTAHFSIPIGEGSPPRRRRGSTRAFGGAFTNFIKGKVTGFVLRFAARKAVGALSRRLEKGVQPGPVIIESATDTTAWTHERDFDSVSLPSDRPARILLLIHGTFSSTRSSYGALTEHEAGQNLLGWALQQYDAVLGYDHYTLADTPAQNADEIFTQLDALQKRSGGLEIDAVSFSRGGLVFRYLTEQIAPGERSSLSFRKAIFVGCTNAGTELADHDNWKTLVDLYTTMVAGASRLLSLHPGSRVAGRILNEGIRIIGSLVKYIAQDAVADNGVPGLAAMHPEGPFVQAINAPPATRERPGARFYYAIGSDFEPGGDSNGKLGKRLALKVADGLVDRLMGEENDLVVDTDSMFVVDPVPSASLSARLPFSGNGVVYHTVYFHQPEVARQCAEWLELAPRMSAIGREGPRDWWASEVTGDFTTLSAGTSASEALGRIDAADSRFVVIERDYGAERLHYGLPRTELQNALEDIGAGGAGDVPLVDALGMHETDENSVPVEEALDSGSIDGFRSRTASIPSYLPGGQTHAVIVDGGTVIGVAAGPDLFDAGQLEEAAPLPDSGGRRGTTRSRRRRSRRSMTAAAGPSTAAAAPVPEPAAVWCYAHASMPEETVLNKKSTVEVTLSRDEIMLAAGLSAAGGGEVRPDENLIVQVQARKNCEVSGDARAEVPVPLPGDDTYLYFDVVAKYEGVGEVRVIVRQGNRPIAVLKLLPRFVSSGSAVSMRRADARADLVPVDQRREITNVLFIREAQMGDARLLDFDLEFEADGQAVRVRGRSKPFADENARIDYITNLYNEIEEFWAESESEYQAFMFRLRERGARIFKELIPANIRKVLWENRDRLEAIQVFSDEPFIPWELAYLVEPGKSIALDSEFLAEKGMVRGYSDPDGITQMAPTRLRLRKGMAKYVIPTYPRGSGEELPGAQDEKKMLKSILDAGPIKPEKMDVVMAMMEPGNFDVLHFACHGVADPESIWNAGLLMQGRMVGGEYRTDTLLADEVDGYANLRGDGAPGPLVVLNACQIGREGYNLTSTGGFARAFMKKGAGAFIGTHWSVEDLSAHDFSQTLYQQLLDGKDMMTAVTAARKAAKNNEEFSWLAYMVYADPYARMVQEG